MFSFLLMEEPRKSFLVNKYRTETEQWWSVWHCSYSWNKDYISEHFQGKRTVPTTISIQTEKYLHRELFFFFWFIQSFPALFVDSYKHCAVKTVCWVCLLSYNHGNWQVCPWDSRSLCPAAKHNKHPHQIWLRPLASLVRLRWGPKNHTHATVTTVWQSVWTTDPQDPRSLGGGNKTSLQGLQRLQWAEEEGRGGGGFRPERNWVRKTTRARCVWFWCLQVPWLLTVKLHLKLWSDRVPFFLEKYLKVFSSRKIKNLDSKHFVVFLHLYPLSP